MTARSSLTVVLAALLLVWYPQPYFRLAGGAGLMMILIGVDVVIGPLLTLVVFNPAKKSLRLDLAVIVALQVAALIYGITVIAQARPVFVVFAGERFTVVPANAIDPESLASAKPPFATLPINGPRTVGARLPDDPGAGRGGEIPASVRRSVVHHHDLPAVVPVGERRIRGADARLDLRLVRRHRLVHALPGPGRRSTRARTRDSGRAITSTT